MNLQLNQRVVIWNLGKVIIKDTVNNYNIYSDEAMSFLKSPNVYIFMGTEAKGLPESIINVSKNVMIPSLSSSINVGNAFSIILTVMIMSNRRHG